MKEGLKECPICGNKAIISEATRQSCSNESGWSRKFEGYYIRCSTPNCIRFPSRFRILEKGIYAWNRRSTPKKETNMTEEQAREELEK